jgi:hypothetical protein
MSNPYMLRLELLKMAQQALDNEYYQKVDLVRTDWNNKVTLGMESNKIIPQPDLPPIYTMEQIVEKAQILNNFVSQG